MIESICVVVFVVVVLVEMMFFENSPRRSCVTRPFPVNVMRPIRWVRDTFPTNQLIGWEEHFVLVRRCDCQSDLKGRSLVFVWTSVPCRPQGATAGPVVLLAATTRMTSS